MKNIQIEQKGDILTLTIDLSKSQGRSKSGKTEIIATTAGNQKIKGTDAVIGLNCYR